MERLSGTLLIGVIATAVLAGIAWVAANWLVPLALDNKEVILGALALLVVFYLIGLVGLRVLDRLDERKAKKTEMARKERREFEGELHSLESRPRGR